MAIDRRQLGSSRQWLLLGGLLVVLVAVLWMRGGGPGTPANPGQRTSNVQGRNTGRAADDLDVRLEALAADRAQPADIERNPFRFEARRRPQAERRAAPPSPPPDAAPPPPTGPPVPPPIPLKFIGIIESAGAGRMAALTDGRHVFHGREGEIIEGRYRIVRIGVESIVLERVEGGAQQTIRMSGQ